MERHLCVVCDSEMKEDYEDELICDDCLRLFGSHIGGYEESEL